MLIAFRLTSGSGKPIHAVVADDDFIVRLFATDILEQAGFQVLPVEHGDTGDQVLMARHPEIVLLLTDIQMPGSLDGFALARRAAASWPHISVLIASGQAHPVAGTMLDSARFIAKPYDARAVHACLNAMLPEGMKPDLMRAIGL